MSRRYDLAIGFGPVCSCSQTLRGADLQFLSFPFDWIGPETGYPSFEEDVVRRSDYICNGFRDWIRKEDFHTRGANNGDHLTNGMLDYFNHRFDLMFIHDFPRTMPFDESFPMVLAKYKRRIARFLELMDRSRRILVLRVERPDLPFVTPLDSFRTARERLSARYPKARFDFILLHSVKGVPFEKRDVREVEDWFTEITFDYQSKAPGATPSQPDLKLTAAALKDLVSVRDYRTREEIRRHKEALLRKKLAKSGCDTLFQLRWQRLKNSIRKRLGYL